MFAVIYRGYLKNNKEGAYKNAWRLIAEYFIEEKGAIGSCLHQTSDGMWVAYSRWVSKEARDAAWPKDMESIDENYPIFIKDAIVTLKECVDEKRHLPEMCLDVVEDLLSGK